MLHVIDVATGKPTGDVIDRANFGIRPGSTAAGSSTTACRNSSEGAPADRQVPKLARLSCTSSATIRRRIPSSSASACRAAVKLEPADITIAYKPLGSEYMIVQAFNGTQRELRLWTAPVASLNGDKTPWVKIADFEDEVTDVAISGDTVYLMTHKERRASRCCAPRSPSPISRRPNGRRAASEAVVTGIARGQGRALRAQDERRDQRAVAGFEYAPGAKPQPITLPFVGDIDALAADPRVPGVVVQPRRLDALRRLLRLRSADAKGHRHAAAAAGQIRQSDRSRRDRSEGKGARRHADSAVDRAQEGHQARRHATRRSSMATARTAFRRRRSSGRHGCRGSSAAACSRSRTCAAAASTARTGTRPATRRPSPTPGATRSRAPSGWSPTSTRRPRSSRSWAAAPAASSSAARSPSVPISSARRSTRCPCPTRCASSSRPTACRTFRSSAPSRPRKASRRCSR